MRFEYTFRNTPGDYWRFYHGNTYHSTMGIVNIAFTGAMLTLIITKWGATNGLGKALMVIGLLLFPVFQPLFVYFKSIRDAVSIKVDTNLVFDDRGLSIHVNKHDQRIPWTDFYTILKRRTMLVVVPDGMHAYILPNRVLGADKEALYRYVSEMIGKYSTRQQHGTTERK